MGEVNPQHSLLCIVESSFALLFPPLPCSRYLLSLCRCIITASAKRLRCYKDTLMHYSLLFYLFTYLVVGKELVPLFDEASEPGPVDLVESVL